LTRYLLLRNSSLGDVVFALAAVDRLREHDPGAEIAFLVDDRFAAVAAAHPGIDEVLTCPRTSGVGAMLAFRRRLAQRRFDVAVDLQGNAKSAFLLTALRGARTIGFARGASRNLSHLFTGEWVKPPESARHRVDRFLSLLTPLGAGARRAAPIRLRVPEASQERARTVLRQAGSLPKIVMHPGTSAFGLLKRWEPERFGRLAKQLGAIPGAATFVTGAPGERDLVDAAVEASCGAAAAVNDLTGLLDLVALTAEADLVVAGDTGPLHLANRMGTPVVGLFGPKDPAVYGPAYEPSAVVKLDGVPCSPCWRRWCEAPACMAGLPVEPVAYAARRLLTSARSLHPTNGR
jgi:ADP-heptose:LPS heptosyltransferase